MADDSTLILLVDPDTKSRRVLEVSLRKAGYDCFGLASAQRALEFARANSVDLVLSDTDLGPESGFDFCHQLKSWPTMAKVPFIFLTHSHDMADKLRGYELGVDEYIPKPVFVRDVLERIKLLLRRREKEHLSDTGAETVSGDLQDVSVVDILQTIDRDQSTGAVRVENGSRIGTIVFRDGAAIDAHTGPLTAEEAVYRMLGWETGTYTIKYLPEVDRPQRIDDSLTDLVVEGLQRLEQMEALAERCQPIDAIVRVDYKRIGEVARDMPEQVDEIVTLFDGRRSLAEVVEESSIGDLEALQVVQRLLEADLLIPIQPRTEQPDDDFERLTTSPRNPRPDLNTWLTGEHAAVSSSAPQPEASRRPNEERRQEEQALKRREEERKARQEAERQAREEETRRAREEAERRAREEAERKAREEAERREREEAERKAREEAERRRRAEEERLRREEEERRRREEEEHLQRQLERLREEKELEEMALRKAEAQRIKAEQRARELEVKERLLVDRLSGTFTPIEPEEPTDEHPVRERVDTENGLPVPVKESQPAPLVPDESGDPDSPEWPELELQSALDDWQSDLVVERAERLEEERMAALEEALGEVHEHERRQALEAAKQSERELANRDHRADSGSFSKHSLEAPDSPVTPGPGDTLPSTPAFRPPQSTPEGRPLPAPVEPEAAPDADSHEDVADTTVIDTRDHAPIQTHGRVDRDSAPESESEFESFFRRDDSDLYSALQTGEQAMRPGSRLPIFIAVLVAGLILIALLASGMFSSGTYEEDEQSEEPTEGAIEAEEQAEAAESAEGPAGDESAPQPESAGQETAGTLLANGPGDVVAVLVAGSELEQASHIVEVARRLALQAGPHPGLLVPDDTPEAMGEHLTLAPVGEAVIVENDTELETDTEEDAEGMQSAVEGNPDAEQALHEGETSAVEPESAVEEERDEPEEAEEAPDREREREREQERDRERRDEDGARDRLAAARAERAREEEARREERDEEDEEDEVPAVDIERAMERSRRFVDQGRWGEAAAELRQVVESEPRNGDALHLLGQSLLELDEAGEAVGVLERANRANRRDTDVLLLLGIAHQLSNHSEAARETYERYLELDSDGARADEVRRILDNL